MILRDYQLASEEALRAAFREGVRSAILYSATGSGKTCVASHIVAMAHDRGKRALFLGDSIEIVSQTSKTLAECGVNHGIIQGSHPDRKAWETVHVATIQTLQRRDPPPEDLVIVDEAHLCRAATWHQVIDHYRNAGARIIGLTATPCRLDGKGLGALFDRIIYGPSPAELIERGYLAPFRIFAPPGPAMTAVGKVAGDYDKGKRAAVCDTRKLVGDIVAHWLKHASGKLTAVSATSIVHSQHIRDEFRNAGVKAEHVDGTTPRAERKRLLEGLPKREYEVLCQVNICGKGWDCPELEALIDACPTMSLARWLQFVGRGGRIAPWAQKTECVLLDHAGNVRRFGLPDEEREWSLDGAAGVRTKPRDTEEAVRMCKQCWMAFRSSQQACPNCGWKYTGRLCEIEHEAGELEEIQRQRKATAIEEWLKRQGVPERRAKFLEFVRLGAERGYRPGFAIARYRGIFKEDPPREWISEAMAAAAREEDGMGEAVNG